MNYKCLETGIRDIHAYLYWWDVESNLCFTQVTRNALWFIQLLYDGMIVHKCGTSSLMLSRITKFSERHKFDATHYIIVSTPLLLHLIFFNKVLYGNEVEGVHRLGTLAHRNPEFRSISDNGWALNSLCRSWPCDEMLPHPQTSVPCVILFS